MEVFHTSPVLIQKIEEDRLFNDCLFFSGEIYVMSTRGKLYTYSLDLPEDDIINERELYDESVIQHISEALDVNNEVAERMLDGRDNVHGEDGWWIQRKQGECAKKMGYKAASSTDEQGCVYIVPMLGRESDLKLIEVEFE